MSLSMYDASVPVFVRGLLQLSHILKKAEAHAEAKKIDPSVFIQARLAPDMFPLARQVQITSDVVKGGAARLSGAEAPSFADTETTFADLQERIAKTIAFIKSIKPELFKDSGERAIQLKVGGQELAFNGQNYLQQFVLPNLFFHVTATYGILRHNGVELGKKDYLGSF